MAQQLTPTECFFALVRYTVAGTPLPDGFQLTDATVASVTELAKAHDLSQLVAWAVAENQLLPEESQAYQTLQTQCLASVSGVWKLEYEQQLIQEVLEKNQIPYMLMKGSIMRGLYPEAWMRTSCDIDILVHESDLDRASAALQGELNYTYKEFAGNYHDISLFSSQDIHLELHFSLFEHTDNIDKGLQKVWDYITPLDGSACGYKETNEYFLFHHIAHMAYHVKEGGCGVRPLIDLWLIQQKLSYNEAEVMALFRECGLEAFYETCVSLANHWMEGTPETQLAQRLEAYLLPAGVYGSHENMLANRQAEQGGNGNYILHRIFPPYSSLIYRFRWLKDHRWLTPLAWVLRWFSLLRGSVFSRVRNELKTSNSVSDEERAQSSGLLNDLGLI